MHVVITGASTGVGSAIAREFSGRGSRLTLIARRRELLEQVAAGLEGQVRIVPKDLSEAESATDWIAGAVEALGPIDVLVNNAAVRIASHTAEADLAAAERLLRLNLITPLRLTRAVLPDMIQRGGGAIVDVTSLAALAPPAGMYFYNASKAGLAAASESLRAELRDTGVHVVTVYPGIIAGTAMGEEGLAAYRSTFADHLMPHGTPEELAELIRSAVEQRKARVLYPRLNELARLFPAPAQWLMEHLLPPLE